MPWHQDVSSWYVLLLFHKIFYLQQNNKTQQIDDMRVSHTFHFDILILILAQRTRALLAPSQGFKQHPLVLVSCKPPSLFPLLNENPGREMMICWKHNEHSLEDKLITEGSIWWRQQWLPHVLNVNQFAPKWRLPFISHQPLHVASHKW